MSSIVCRFDLAENRGTRNEYMSPNLNQGTRNEYMSPNFGFFPTFEC